MAWTIVGLLVVCAWLLGACAFALHEIGQKIDRLPLNLRGDVPTETIHHIRYDLSVIAAAVSRWDNEELAKRAERKRAEDYWEVAMPSKGRGEDAE